MSFYRFSAFFAALALPLIPAVTACGTDDTRPHDQPNAGAAGASVGGAGGGSDGGVAVDVTQQGNGKTIGLFGEGTVHFDKAVALPGAPVAGSFSATLLGWPF